MQPSEAVTELLPCPFCGSTDLSDMGEYIACADCEADGPFSLDIDPAAAVEKWNTRQSAQPAAPLMVTDEGAKIASLRAELDELYRRETPKDAPKARRGKLHYVGGSIIGRLQQIDQLQRYQIACLERALTNPPKHKFWGAGEPNCPREIKAGNGELHTLRCKVCGQDNPRDDRCLAALTKETGR